MKRETSTLLWEVLALLCFVVLPSRAEQFGPFTYQVTEDAVTITFFSRDAFAVDLEIPSQIEGRPVTSIGPSAFSDSRLLSSVTVPDSVTSIGESAFARCYGLTSVAIPGSVLSIGAEAFSDCVSLTSIVVAPGNIHYVSADGVLFDASMTTLIACPGGRIGAYTIPNTVTTVGDSAFSRCYSLTEQGGTLRR